MPTRELPNMPVAPTTSATLRKCPSGAAAACSSCGCVWAAAPIARLHHQLIVLVRTYVAAGLEIEQNEPVVNCMMERDTYIYIFG